MDPQGNAASSSKGEGICVGIRMRPLNDREIQSGQEKIFKCVPNCNAITHTNTADTGPGQIYYYDKVFDECSSNADIYSHIAEDIVRGTMNGINGTIFAYGQTSSGKTHTMLGGGDQRGVLGMAAEDIFRHISSHPHRDFLLRASFVEIYNENIRDLLSDAADATVNIREDPRKGVYCEATEIVITDFGSINSALKKGISKRVVEATAMNDTSSRSHTIFKLVIESKESARVGYEPDGAVLVATLNLVDLAGSESVKHTGAMGQRAKEGGKINQSLLSLSRVIHALSQPGAHVNFRDSKLTRLLQPSLCGNAKMSIVCCITPADRYLEETRSTLQFASRAKLVTTNATVNEVLDESAKMKRLMKELEELRVKQRSLATDGASGSNSNSSESIAALESEKNELLSRLKALEEEKAEQQLQLGRLQSLINAGDLHSQVRSRTHSNVFGGDDQSATAAVTDSVSKSRRKRTRDTWCPGSLGVPLPSINMSVSSVPLSLQSHSSNRVSSGTTLSSTDSELAVVEEVDEVDGMDEKFEYPVCLQCVENQTERSALVSSIQDKEVEINQLKSACSAHEVQLRSLEEQLANVIDDNSNKESLLAAIFEKEEQISQLLNSCAELEKQCESLNQQLEAEVLNATSIRNESQALMDAVACKESERMEILRENENLLQSMQEKDLQIQNLLESLTSTENKLLRSQEMNQYNMDLSEEVQRKEKEIVDLRATLEMHTAESMESKLSMTKDIQRLENEVEDAKRTLEEKSIFLSDAQSQQEILNQQLEVEMGANAEFQRERDNEVQQLIELQEEKQRSIDLLVQENNQKLEEFNLYKQSQQAVVYELEDKLAVKEREYLERLTQLEMKLVEVQQTSILDADNRVNDLESQLSQAKIQSNLDTEVIAACKEKVQSLENMLTDSRANSETLQLAMSALELSLKESQTAQEKLSFAMSEAELINNELQAKLSVADEQLESSIKESQAATEALLVEVSSLKLEINGIHDSYAVDKDRSLSEWNNDRATLQQSSVEMKIQIENLTSQLEALTKENEQQIRQIQKLQQCSQSRMSMLSHQTKVSEISITQESIDGARREMEKQIEIMRAELGNREGEISKLLSSNADLQNRLNSAEQAINSTLNKEMSSCDGEAALRKRCGQLQTCVDLLKGEKDTLQSKCNQLEGKLKNNSNRLESEVEDLQRKLNAQSQAAEKMQTEISHMASLRDSNIHLERSLSELKKDRNSIAQERLQLQDECKNLADQLLAMSQNENNKEQMECLQSQVRTAREREDQLCRDKQALEEDIRELSGRAKKAKDDANLIKSEWMSIETELNTAKKESQTLRADLEISLQQIAALTEALENKESVEQGNENNLSDQEEIEGMRIQVSELIAENKYQQELIERLHTVIGEKDRQIECVENTVLDLNSSLQEAQGSIECSKSLKDKLDTVTNEMVTLREEFAASVVESQTAQAMLQQAVEKLQCQLVASNNNLNQLNEESEAEVELLQEEIVALKEQNAKFEAHISMHADKIAIKEEEGKLLLLRISLTEQDLEDQKTINIKDRDSKNAYIEEVKEKDAELSCLHKNVRILKSALGISDVDSNDSVSVDQDFEILFAAIKDRFAQYEQRIVSFQEQSSQFEAQAIQATQLSQLNAANSSVAADLLSELEVCKSQLSAAENSLLQIKAEKESQIYQLQIDLEALQKASHDLTAELEKKASSLVELQLQVEDTQAEKERECFELTEEILSLQRDNEAAVSQHHLVVTECEQKQLEILSLQSAINLSNAAVGEAQSQLSSKGDEIQTLQLLLENLQKERNVLEEQLAVVENQSADKEAQSQEVVMLKRTVSELEDTVLHLQELQQKSERQHADMEQELQESEDRLAAAIQGLETERQTSLERISSLESDLSATLLKLQQTEAEVDAISTHFHNKQSLDKTLCTKKDEEIAVLLDQISEYEAERDTLESQIKELQQSLASSKDEVNAQSEQTTKKLQALKVEVTQLRQAYAEREDAMAQLENELYELRQEQAQAVSSAVEESEKDLLTAKTAAKELTAMLQARDSALQSMQEHCNAVEEMLTSLRSDMTSQLELKDKRIAHLETSKLTQEQLERIKVMKEERKKFQEDAKVLKKQLARLKTAYDELKEKQLENSEAAVASKATSSNSDFVISDLKFQVVEVTAQLSQSQAISQTLKDKLRDCAKQLQEYESDRSAVILILEKHGIDTSGLNLSDGSVSDVSTLRDSSCPQDIADAVSKLAEKLTVAQSILTNRETAKSNKQKDLEEKLSHAMADVEDLKSTKLATEKRAESAKNSLRIAREEVAKLTVDLEGQKSRVEELQQDLLDAEKRVANSSDTVHSEIQVLEEENIELMRENKELRVEVSRYKAALTEKTSTASSSSDAAPPALKASKVALSPMINVQEVAVPPSTIGTKRAFGREIDGNSLPSDGSEPPSKSSFVEKQSTLASIAASNGAENADTAAQNPGLSQRKVRTKAKALIGSAQTAEDNGGECAQS